MAPVTKENCRMVSLEAVKASNVKLKSLRPGLVALFGATSGIGESTMKQFCKHTEKPRVYFVGRSQDSGSRILNELKTLQPDGIFNFIQKDVTLLKNVDEVCNEIQSKESTLNILFMTQGTLSLKGLDETSEGIDRKLATNYYSRIRFATRLLPLLEAASPRLSRVISVLAPGEEKPGFNLDDLGLKSNFSLRNAANHAITMTDLAFEELARQNPSVSFVHAYPGAVKTGFFKEQSTVMRLGVRALMTVFSPLTLNIEESGERHLYAATSTRYPAKYGKEEGVDIGDEKVAKSSDGQIGSGAYLLGWGGEFRANEQVLKGLRESGAGSKVWEHTMDIFKSISGVPSPK